VRLFAVRSRPYAAANERGAPASSFDALILPHLDGAYNLARFLTRDELMSEDAVQDAVLRAFRSFDQFRGESPRAWLFAIVRNCCRTALGARNAAGLHLVEEAEGESADVDEADNPEQALIRASDAAMVRAMVEALPEPFREAIVLRDLEELSYREIAQVTRVAMGTVMSRISRGRGMLADQLSARAADQTRKSQ
jgi:RNA polymerase sigma-70 factor (ECF subfamily)